ncbi:MAG: hypothetical protein LQ345_007064 [Seirophora villosa]|nr:MAG: hypothetical protein LQ345_007064 [Seirophora villosa]
MDGLGAVSLVGGITCLLLALQWGGQTSPWRSVKIIGLLTGSAALSALLGFLQGKLGEHATIPLRILRQRSILMGCIFIALLDLTAYTVSGVRPWHAFTRLMCTNVITTEAPVRTPTITPQTIIETGSTRLGSLAPSDELVLAALHMLYSVAVTRTLILALATAAAALPFAVCMEWKNAARKLTAEGEGEEANQDSDCAVEKAPDGIELVRTESKPKVHISAQS